MSQILPICISILKLTHIIFTNEAVLMEEVDYLRVVQFRLFTITKSLLQLKWCYRKKYLAVSLESKDHVTWLRCRDIGMLVQMFSQGEELRFSERSEKKGWLKLHKAKDENLYQLSTKLGLDPALCGHPRSKELHRTCKFPKISMPHPDDSCWWWSLVACEEFCFAATYDTWQYVVSTFHDIMTTHSWVLCSTGKADTHFLNWKYR